MKLFEVNVYIATTWTSPAQKNGKVMWLVEFIKKDNTPETREGILMIEGTEMEAILAGLKTAISILTKSCSVRGFMRKNGVLNAYQNDWISKWKENDFKNSKGEDIKHKGKWQELLKILEKHEYSIEEGLGEYAMYMDSKMTKNVDFPLNEEA